MQVALLMRKALMIMALVVEHDCDEPDDDNVLLTMCVMQAVVVAG